MVSSMLSIVISMADLTDLSWQFTVTAQFSPMLRSITNAYHGIAFRHLVFQEKPNPRSKVKQSPPQQKSCAHVCMEFWADDIISSQAM